MSELEIDNTSSTMANQPVGFSKRHVSGMLKHMTDNAQRAKALDTAAMYKRLFAEPKWEPVLSNLQCFAEEDRLRFLSSRRLHPSLTTSASALSSDTDTTPISLPRHSTYPAPSTPRERWDVLHRRGPVTPLSPSPMGNAFADGGFWFELSPKTPVPQTPDSAILTTACSPVIPEDAEARAAYDVIKAEVDAMARTVCARRMSIRDSGAIPQTLIRARDVLRGAQIVTAFRQVDVGRVVDAHLPRKLQAYADEEARIYAQYTLHDLKDIDAWLSVDEDGALSTVLDARRELVGMHRNRRKSRDLRVAEKGLLLAWAVRVLEDVERAVELEDDGESDDSDETRGYDYGNFLRSLRGESSDVASLMTGARSSATESLTLSRESTFASQSQRSSTSPTKPQRGSTSPARSRRSSTSPTKHTGLTFRTNLPTTTEPRHSLTVSIPSNDSAIVAPEPSPHDKAQRRMGAHHAELDAWAAQLRTMQDPQTSDKDGVVSVYAGGVHPALRGRQRGDTANETGDADAVTVMKDDEERPKLPKGFKYAPTPTSPPPSQIPVSGAPVGDTLHDARRRRRHVRSRSSVQRKEEWGRELEMMEGAERARQLDMVGLKRRGGMRRSDGGDDGNG
jgi:hypothetical protein